MELPENQNRRLKPTGVGMAGKTHGLTGTGPSLACQDAVGQVFGQVWNLTEQFEQSKPELLVGYQEPLLILPICLC
jgi:hypothetical protein